MKTSTLAAVAAMAFVPFTLAQDPGPSPTASIGCEPHGDHWHCEAARETGESSVDPGPSPTASIGCEPHGDHWHCDGPRKTGGRPEQATPTHDHDHDDDHEDDEHDHHDDGDDHDTAEAGPSPTESVGCEPHGDHWHCDGPRETSSGSADSDSATTSSGESPEETAAAAGLMVPVAGALAMAAFVL